MNKNDITTYLIFLIVFFTLISAPYWFDFLGAAVAHDTVVYWCFHEPGFINPKPTWVNVPQGGSATFIAYVKSTATTAPNALDSVNVYTPSSYFSFELLSLEGVMSTSAVIPNITKIIVNITSSATTPLGHQALISITVAGNASAICGNQSINLTGNVTINQTALPVPPPPPAPVEGEGGSACTEESIVCGPCQNGYKTCIIDRCGTTTSQVESCPTPRGYGCNSDGDCPEGQVCRNNQCIEPAQEIEELPVELPFMVYPSEWTAFFNEDLIEYQTPGITEAVRRDLLILPSKLDFSMYNLYYGPQETPLGIWLSKQNFLRKVAYLFLVSLLVLSIVMVVLKAVKTRKEGIDYNLNYSPPNQ